METIFKYCQPNNQLYNLITSQQQQRMTRRITTREIDIIKRELNMLDKQLRVWNNDLQEFQVKMYDKDLQDFRNKGIFEDLRETRQEAIDHNTLVQLSNFLVGMTGSIVKLVRIGGTSKASTSLIQMQTDKVAFLTGAVPIDSTVQGEIKDVIASAISIATPIILRLNPTTILATATVELSSILTNLIVFGSTNPKRWFEKTEEDGIKAVRISQALLSARRQGLLNELRRGGYTPYQTLANPFN